MKQVSIAEATALLRAAGYTVSKKKASNKKPNGVGPTFVAHWTDGVTTRMSICTPDHNPDMGLGVRVSQAAYDSRTKGLGYATIKSGHFERDGRVLRSYSERELAEFLPTWRMAA